VPAHRDTKAQTLDRQAADDKGRPRHRVGKEHQRGYGEKESGWHHQQSSVFHLRPFPGWPIGGLHNL
jgi:hypothetical protein